MSQLKPRVWTIHDGAMSIPKVVGPDIAYAETVQVIEKIHFDKAIEALKSICGERCAHQNPCEAKDALIELGEV